MYKVLVCVCVCGGGGGGRSSEEKIGEEGLGDVH